MFEYPHPHLTIPANGHQFRFKGKGRGTFNRRELSREQHAARLQHQLRQIASQFEEELKRRADTDSPEDFGLLLNIQSAPGYPLKLDSLEKKPTKTQDGIYLLNVRYKKTENGNITSAAVLVPFGQLKTLANKVSAYANPLKDKKSPSNADLLANMDAIGVATLEALWTEPEPIPESSEPLWWELWVSRAPRADNQHRPWLQVFEETSRSLKLEVNQFRLRLPDHEIVLLKATRAQLEGSLDLLNTLTEVRKARACSIDLSELPGSEQYEWIEEALERIQWPDRDAPAVCLLDTGVNREHPLLSNLLSENDMDTVLPHIGTADHPNPRDAHGTPMAGLAAFDDLRHLMLSNEIWPQSHLLESVKLIHDGYEHIPENYGAVTNQAIARPEARNPHRRRVYCLALSRSDFSAEGRPSSWSAGIDAGAAGTGEEYQPRRVVFVSAGNHRIFDNNFSYPDSNIQSPIEDPAQAWNGLTVGAMTRLCEITEKDDESRRARAVAGHQDLSPFSRTSVLWDPRWPIKPDIVMEGGNLAQTESGYYVERDSLEPISTASNFLTRPLCNMNATSAATASAARLGAMLMARFPGYWPETYRGLVVHSAQWRPRMLGNVNPHTTGSSGEVQKILRLFGFGEPHQPRLFGSGESGVTMIIQDTIQPYDRDSKAGEAKLGYFNLHDLPWPKEVFDQHRDVELTLTVTLSYFIDPNPGSRCWDRSKKYRYASHLLRFDFKRAAESEDVFRQALEKRVEQEEEEEELVELDVKDRRSPSDPRWALGPQLRGKAGSLVQDVWKGSPADLAEMGQVAIYPAKGWFATRSFPEDHEFYNCHQRSVRYSLIISIDAAQEIGLYTSISNIISLDA